MNMDAKTAEYLMALIDDAERAVSSDYLAEEKERVSYSIKSKPSAKPVSSFDELYREISSCHECGLCFSRRVFARPIIKKGLKVLFIISGPDGDALLSDEKIRLFRSWWHDSIYLEEGEWGLTTLVKCPSGTFSYDAAGKCKGYLRTEMAESNPSAMVVMGHEAASYILGKNASMDEMRGRRYKVNGIPLFVTYSLDEFLGDSANLRKKVWSDMLMIRSALGLEERKH